MMKDHSVACSYFIIAYEYIHTSQDFEAFINGRRSQMSLRIISGT